MIETTITKIQYDADGVQRRWSIPFPYADVKHISIYTKVGEEPMIKVVDNYDIDEDDSIVICPTVASGQEPLATGTKIIIARETPETQLEDASQVHFTSKDVERGLDKLTMITQELSTTAGETMEVAAAAFESAEEAVNSAALANNTAEEAKTIAGQAVYVATDAKSIAEGIDAKATQALDNSNTAINIANSAKQIAEGVDDKATQALTNSNTSVNIANSAKQTAEGVDSKATQALTNSTTAFEKATEAKNTADSYQGQITTLRNDVDDIGDQVSVIEAKIPINAYTEDNLIAGNDIEIVPEPVEANFDEHTLACFHFENNFDNEITGSPVGVSNTAGSFTQDYKKFGQYSLAGGPCITVTHSVDNNDFTTDAWVFLNNNYAWHPIEVGTISITPNNGGWDVSGDGINKRYVPDIYLNTWMHVAVVRKTMVYYVFFNGKLTAVSDVSSTVNNTLFSWQANSFYYALDELRISDVARWTEDFNPPTQAYPIAVPTGNYVVRNKTKLVHQSDIGVANGVASLDENGKVPAEQITTGSGFDFEGTKAEFDAAVAAGTITDDSVSLITDDVSGDNVATKAELQDRVSKSGDTMTGTLKMSGENEIRFGTDDNYYYVRKNTNGDFIILNGPAGFYLAMGDNYKPYYTNGTQHYRLLTTADKGVIVGWGMPDYSAGVSLTVGTEYTADIDCYVLFSVRNVNLNNDVGFYINNIEVAKLGNNFAGSDDWAGFFIPKGTNFKAKIGNGTTAIYAKYPLKGVN